MSEAAIALKKGFELNHANATLLNHKLDTFKQLCKYYDVETTGKKQALLDRLSPKIPKLPKQPKVSIMANFQKYESITMIKKRTRKSGSNPNHGDENVKSSSTKNRRAVLGRELLAAVRIDIERTQLPSWIQSAPTDIGNISHGKLSADEWRTTATVHLVLTLIRLWGHYDVGVRKRQMLDNYMQLVRAVSVAGSLRISEEDIKEYESSLLSYLRGLKDLYKEATIKPNHHIAVHLPVFLRRFGPVPAWRAFAFERFNYLLQNTNTNKKPGRRTKFIFIAD